MDKEKHRVWKKLWRKKNPEKEILRRKRAKLKYPNYYKDYYRKRTLICINHYSGGKNNCACCGEKTIEFLSIDHIDGGGTLHRKKTTSKTTDFLCRNNFPPGYQVLCFNCNWGKYRGNGLCPHKRIYEVVKTQ